MSTTRPPPVLKKSIFSRLAIAASTIAPLTGPSIIEGIHYHGDAVSIPHTLTAKAIKMLLSNHLPSELCIKVADLTRDAWVTTVSGYRALYAQLLTKQQIDELVRLYEEREDYGIEREIPSLTVSIHDQGSRIITDPDTVRRFNFLDIDTKVQLLSDITDGVFFPIPTAEGFVDSVFNVYESAEAAHAGERELGDRSNTIYFFHNVCDSHCYPVWHPASSRIPGNVCDHTKKKVHVIDHHRYPKTKYGKKVTRDETYIDPKGDTLLLNARAYLLGAEGPCAVKFKPKGMGYYRENAWALDPGLVKAVRIKMQLSEGNWLRDFNKLFPGETQALRYVYYDARLAVGRVYAQRLTRKVQVQRDYGTRNIAYGPQLRDGPRRTERREREQVQREAARLRRRSEWKAKPKEARARAIRNCRDKRNPIVLQSGVRIKKRDVITAGATLVGLAGIKRLFKLLIKAHRTADSIDSAANSINVFFTRLRTAADEVGNYLGAAFKFVPLTLICYYLLRNTVGVSDALVAALTAILAQFVGTRAWQHISKFFRARDVEMQSGVDAAFVEQAGGLLSTLFVCQAFAGKHPKASAEFMKRVGSFPKMAQGIEGFVTWMLKSLEKLVNLTLSMFGKERVQLYHDVYANVNEWKRKVDVVCAEDIINGAPTTGQLDTMINLIREGYAFKDVYRTTRIAQSIEQTLGKITSALLPYQGALSSRNNFRFEPSSLFLTGVPGIGKTLLAMPLCATIMIEAELMERGVSFSEIAKQIWQKGTSEYWNGYAGQTCLVMDDAFQARVGSTTPDNDYMNIIRMVSSWSFPLNFADLASKGKIYFGSKFIYATTNLDSISSEAAKVLNEPEAVVRRITHPYRLSVAPEFQTQSGKLDYAKFCVERDRCAASSIHSELFPWHVWRATRHNFTTGQPIGNPVPLRTLIDEVVSDLRARMATHDSTKVGLEDYVSRLNKLLARNDPADKGFIVPRDFKRDLPPTVIPTDVSPSVTERDLIVPHRETAVVFNESINLQGGLLKGVRGMARGLKLFLWRLHGIDIINTDREPDAGLRRAGEYLQASKVEAKLFEKNRKFHTDFGEFGEINKTLLSTLGLLSSLFISHTLWLAVKLVCRTIFNVFKNIVQLFMPHKQPDKQSNRPDTRKAAKLQSKDDSIITNIYNNTYKMYACRHGGVEPIGQIIFLMHGLAVQPLHFTSDLKELIASGEMKSEDVVGFRNSGNPQHVITFSVGHYLSLKRQSHPDRELEFVDFGSIRAHRNITKNFLTDRQIRSVGGKLGRLDICHIGDSALDKTTRTVYTCQNLQYGTNLLAGKNRIKEYFQYRAPTANGDCGAPLCLYDSTSFSGRTCFGFHVAGRPNNGIGYASVITQELIHSAVEELGIIKDAFEPDMMSRIDGVELQSAATLPFTSHGSFLPLYRTNKPATICPKSSYKPTDLMGRFGHQDNLPAHLSPVEVDGVLVFPMNNAVAPYSSPLRVYEHKWMKQALHVAMKPFIALSAGHTRDLFTFEEAILGVPEQKFRSIPRGTAAGYPYTLTARDGKKSFFGEEDTYDLTSPECVELRSRVAYITKAASQNVRLSHVFTDFLKDEIRPRAKVEAVATRLISSAPLDYVIAFRQYFGAFSSAVMLTHTESGLAPGICTYSDWDALATRLSSKGQSVFDGDFKQFDASEQPCVHDLVLDFINAWYDDGAENARVRRVLWLELTHSRHIGGIGFDQSHIYQWSKSLPSGHPFTTIINSIYSLFMLVSAYIHCTGDFTNFWDYVIAVVYGDDNVVNVDDKLVTVFNQTSVAQAIKKMFEVTYTSSDKGGELGSVKTLPEVGFLKRGFLLEQDRWLCPLELESFLFTSYWCKNQKKKEEIIEDVLEMALEELSLHPREVWGSTAWKILEAMSERGLVPKCPPDRDSYQMLVTSRKDNWY